MSVASHVSSVMRQQWQLQLCIRFAICYYFLSSCGMWQLNEFIYTSLLINWTRYETHMRLSPTVCVCVCACVGVSTHTHTLLFRWKGYSFSNFGKFVTLRKVYLYNFQLYLSLFLSVTQTRVHMLFAWIDFGWGIYRCIAYMWGWATVANSEYISNMYNCEIGT